MPRLLRSLPSRWLAVLATLFVAFGLPHHLVVCDHGDGGHLEFRHAPGAHDELPATADAAPTNGARGGTRTPPRATERCEHVEFDVVLDLARLQPPSPPQPVSQGAVALVPATPATAPIAPALAARAPPRRPPIVATCQRLLL